MITSPQNPKIKRVRRLQDKSNFRDKEEAFVVEGVRLVEESLRHGWPPEMVFYTSELDKRGYQIVEQFRSLGVHVTQISSETMESASDTETPQGLLAVLPLKRRPQPQKLDFVLLPDSIRDPGNLGTLLRTALAADVDLVLLPPGSVDPYAPKVVRAAMGAHFRLPVTKTSWAEIRNLLTSLHVYLAEAGKGKPYPEADLRRPLALVVGNESRGPGPESQRMADDWLHIPMPGNAESLNVAVAGSILLFEVVRQRAMNNE